MSKRIEKTLLVLSDFLTINAAWLIYYVIRVNTGWFELIIMPEIWMAMFIVYLYWLVIFTFLGLYRSWFALSRSDEVFSLFKGTFYGSLALFFIVFVDDTSRGIETGSRMLILIYWGIMLSMVASGRLFIRALQRKLLIKGIGRKNALIIGTGKTAWDLKKDITEHRALGIDIIGFLDTEKPDETLVPEAVPVLGRCSEFDEIVKQHDIKEIIFASDHKHEDIVIETISRCDGREIGLKIVPDLYEIISGHAKTSQLYSVPLVDINPALMPVWEEKIKRIMDTIAAVIFLIIASPIILITAIAIKLESRGPVFYAQERCGLNGKSFKMVKFRSMRADAEKASGPVWAQKDDPRITKIGRFIRKVRIDELPQMWNVIKGEMSLVGPRPERPFFVEKFAKEIPYYKRRLRVRPGITGWAQVKHKYDETMDDVKEKLKYDLFYIENMSLRMDIKILMRTIFIVVFGKGHYE